MMPEGHENLTVGDNDSETAGKPGGRGAVALHRGGASRVHLSRRAAGEASFAYGRCSGAERRSEKTGSDRGCQRDRDEWRSDRLREYRFYWPVSDNARQGRAAGTSGHVSVPASRIFSA